MMNGGALSAAAMRRWFPGNGEFHEAGDSGQNQEVGF